MRLRVPVDLLRPPRLVPQSQAKAPLTAVARQSPSSFFNPSRTLAQVHPNNDLFLNVGITGSPPKHQEPQLGQRPDSLPPDERTIKLGKSNFYSPTPLYATR